MRPNTRFCFARHLTLLMTGGAVLTLAGCRNMGYADNAALVGSGIGAVMGAAVGDRSGNAGGGALIGAATGAIAGGLIGTAEEAQAERDVALAQLAANQQPALQNHDLIYMAQSGLAEEVIINAVHTRGGRFNLTPTGLVELRQSGVTDRVILAAQQAVPAPTVIVAPPRPDVVIVRPEPSVRFTFGAGPRYWRHHHHCDPW